MGMIINTRDKIAPFIQREGIVNNYISDIRKYKLLPKEEEIELIKIAQDENNPNSSYAIEKIVNANQRFVLSAAMSYSSRDNLLDLVNEGNIGLINAIKRYDFTKDVKFISYAAFWIRKTINAYLTNYDNMVVPANANKLRVVVHKAKHAFLTENQRMPTLEELKNVIKEKFNFNVKDISDLETFQSLSIDEPSINDDSEETFGDNSQFTSVTASNNIDDDIDEDDKKTVVEKLLNKLNKTDKKIIKKVFGIGCIEESYDTISEEMNLSKERVRQKVQKIIKELGTMIDQQVV